MKKTVRTFFLFILLSTGFSFIENHKMLCGVWTANIYSSLPNTPKRGIDTLHIKRNGRFVLKKYSTVSLPGIYAGKWSIEKDSLVLDAEAGGMLIVDEKGHPVTEKLKEKKKIKFSITIHSKEEIYLSTDNCNFARVKKY
jgi:hypothetical protein